MIPTRGWPRISPYELLGIVSAWEPPAKPHCSNCRWAKVTPPTDDPLVVCAMGQGKPLTLVSMIRPKAARQFIPAVRCPDFASMSDEGETR